MNLFAWMDRHHIFNINVWEFSFRSLFQQYGWLFFFHVVLRHPIKTLKGIAAYQKNTQKRLKANLTAKEEPIEKAPPSIVGLGFCLKPIDPPCPSGRANHDCFFFEHLLYDTPNPIPPSCKICTINKIGMRALNQGYHVYIMTSAKDILLDMLLPALREQKFTRGHFAICQYSFEAFELALTIAGIQGRLLPFESGDCRDYHTWLLADEGFKNEQTTMASNEYNQLCGIFSPNRQEALNRSSKYTVVKEGNIFYSIQQNP